MILLLDANALLWWLADDAEISEQARSAIADPFNQVLVSAATVWELEIKRGIGKLSAPEGLVDALEPQGFGSLPITGSDAEVAGSLPLLHRDPFDRMLVAQARRIDAVIVSRDATFELYQVERIAA